METLKDFTVEGIYKGIEAVGNGEDGRSSNRLSECHVTSRFEKTQTTFTYFILLGFQNSKDLQILITLIFLVIYCMIFLGNLMIIVLVSYNKTLQSPMYFFLTQLSTNDILLTTVIIPNTLYVSLNDVGTISFAGCITQFYFFGASETSECLLLTVMSYDRYLAICNPLRYSVLMDRWLCLKLVIVSWILSFSAILIDTLSLSRLEYCRSNIIDHFFCDLDPLLEISCSDTYFLQLEVSLLSTPLVVMPFLMIVISYVFIIFSILKIQSKAGRQKAFSTCSSHLSVVIMFYGALIGIYVLPSGEQTLDAGKILSLSYTVVIPLLNPIIYSLRNKEIKEALKKVIKKTIM
ncbi:olfactory receptor 1500-like [Pyxicephalus adspersus]|uniref:olfactory receptor 1500-like n=1 Tax=Pyxicephalus adspersus TaxID=30357 RepID=UPI003B590EC7